MGDSSEEEEDPREQAQDEWEEDDGQVPAALQALRADIANEQGELRDLLDLIFDFRLSNVGTQC